MFTKKFIKKFVDLQKKIYKKNKKLKKFIDLQKNL